MSTSAPGPHLRYAELKGWLRENGISEHVLKSLLNQRVIKTLYLKSGGRGFYNADQVKRDVLDPLDQLLLK